MELEFGGTNIERRTSGKAQFTWPLRGQEIRDPKSKARNEGWNL